MVFLLLFLIFFSFLGTNASDLSTPSPMLYVYECVCFPIQCMCVCLYDLDLVIRLLSLHRQFNLPFVYFIYPRVYMENQVKLESAQSLIS